MTLLISAIVIVVVSVGLALTGLLAVRRSVEMSRLRDHHEVAGFFIGIIGAIYSVLMAFVVVIVWEDFRDIDANVSSEANQLVDISWLAQGLSDVERDRVRHASRTYARAVINQEWEALASGKSSPEAESALA